jgi:hypothetical protein
VIAIAIPAMAKARDVAQEYACINNMRMLDAAKQQAAMKNNYSHGSTVSENEVSEYLKDGFSGVVCPNGGQYSINPLGRDPACSEHGALSDAMNRRQASRTSH